MEEWIKSEFRSVVALIEEVQRELHEHIEEDRAWRRRMIERERLGFGLQDLLSELLERPGRLD